MGNSSSTSNKSPQKEFQNFYEVIDYIATYYILTMDFKSLSKLSEKEYCDKLVVLSSEIIEQKFNDLEVTYLEQRVKNGVNVNELTKDNIIFLNKEHLEGFDVQNDVQRGIKKKRQCIGIAKFFVKIAHIFAAIVMTINPVYTYKDANGNITKAGLIKKDKIPKNTDRKLYKLNICDNRIKSLKRGETYSKSTSEKATIYPKVCSINQHRNGVVKNLSEEPGITELMRLYLDDKYDYSTGTFTGMTPETERQFKQDLQTFYTAFTGNETMPAEYTKFSDIKLRDYNNIKKGCQGKNPLFKKMYSISKNDKLFIKYASSIKKMIESAASTQNELLSVIDELFKFTKDNKIRVNPKLTDESLQKAVEKTRRIIIDLYVNCERDYVDGLKIYESIVEAKILETNQNQIKTAERESEKLIQELKSETPSIDMNITNQNQPLIVTDKPINITN